MRGSVSFILKGVCIAILVGLIGGHTNAQSKSLTCGIDQPEAKSGKPNRANQQAMQFIPFSYVSRNILIDAYLLNAAGKPAYAKFVIDTGQSRTMIDRSLVESLGLPVVGEGDLTSATGTIPAKYVDIGVVELGDRYYCKNIEAAVYDLSKFSKHLSEQVGGIIGMDFLKHFNLLIDIPRGRFGFVESSKLPDEFKEMRNAHLDYRNGLLMLTCELSSGVEINLIVDTGDEYPEYILLYDDAVPNLELHWPFSSRLGGDLIGSTAIQSGQIPWIDFGNLHLAPASVVIEPLTQVNQYDTPFRPGEMGMGLLEKFAVEIDGPGLRLHFLEGPKVLSPRRKSPESRR